MAGEVEISEGWMEGNNWWMIGKGKMMITEWTAAAAGGKKMEWRKEGRKDGREGIKR